MGAISSTFARAAAMYGKFTQNPDGSITFTSGPYTGQTAKQALFSTVPSLNFGNNQYLLLGGPRAGQVVQDQSFASKLGKAALGTAGVLAGGFGLAALAGGGAAAAGTAASAGTGASGGDFVAQSINGVNKAVTNAVTGGGAAAASAGAGGLGSWGPAISAGISAGSNIAGNLIAANASKTAANTQAQYGEQALELQKRQTAVAQQKIDEAQQILRSTGTQQGQVFADALARLDVTAAKQGQLYNSSVANLAPYKGLGDLAAGKLSGQPGAPSAAAGVPIGSITTGIGLTAGPSSSGGPASVGQTLGQIGASAPPAGSTPVPVTALAPPASLTTTTPQAQAAASRTSSYVTMQAPDGSQSSVPAQLVPHYQSLGAEVVQ